MRPKLLKTLNTNSAEISAFAPDYICNKLTIVGVPPPPNIAEKHTEVPKLKNNSEFGKDMPQTNAP